MENFKNNATAVQAATTTTATANDVVASQVVADVAVMSNNVSAPIALPSVAKATYAFNQITIEIERLAVERAHWEDTHQRIANEYLYAILQKCYRFYKSMEGNSEAAKSLRQALKDYTDTKGYKFHDSTHTINKIVRCVFGSLDVNVAKQRISNYALALRAALKDNIAVDALPEHLVNEGGVEELRGRATGRTSGLKASEKVLIAEKTVEKEDMGDFKHPVLGENFENGKTDKPVVLLCTWKYDGTVKLRAVVQSKTAVSAALKGYYNDTKAAREKQQVDAEQQMLNAVTANAVDVAAVQAVLNEALNG